MKKDELIRAISADTGIDQQSIKIVLESLLLTLVTQLKMGNAIQLNGFGSFRIKQCASRKYKDIHTGKLMSLPERRTIKFTIAKDIINYINIKKK